MFVFVLFLMSLMLLFYLNCLFVIAPSVFSNSYVCKHTIMYNRNIKGFFFI